MLVVVLLVVVLLTVLLMVLVVVLLPARRKNASMKLLLALLVSRYDALWCILLHAILSRKPQAHALVFYHVDAHCVLMCSVSCCVTVVSH
jgi:hypothetical protein